MKLNIHLHASRAAGKTRWLVGRRTRIKTTRLLLSLQQTQRRICMRRHLSSRLLYVFSTRLRRRDVSSAAQRDCGGDGRKPGLHTKECDRMQREKKHLFIRSLLFYFRTSVQLPPSTALFAISESTGYFQTPIEARSLRRQRWE